MFFFSICFVKHYSTATILILICVVAFTCRMYTFMIIYEVFSVWNNLVYGVDVFEQMGNKQTI